VIEALKTKFSGNILAEDDDKHSDTKKTLADFNLSLKVLNLFDLTELNTM
jgi:hypothetical protein